MCVLLSISINIDFRFWRIDFWQVTSRAFVTNIIHSALAYISKHWSREYILWQLFNIIVSLITSIIHRSLIIPEDYVDTNIQHVVNELQETVQDSRDSSEEKSTTTLTEVTPTNPQLQSRAVSCATRAGTTIILQTDEELIQILKDKGGSFLPRYMAVDVKSAALQFPNLLTMTSSYQVLIWYI